MIEGNILVTGARGFIGFNMAQMLVAQRPGLKIVCTDNETYADKFLQEKKDAFFAKHGIEHFKADLSLKHDIQLLENVVKDFKIRTILHYAAESHVDNSLKDPLLFANSNVVGTAAVCSLAKDFSLRLHVVSTDEVYGITRPEDYCYEDYPLSPSSPYSASKAASELIALSYAKSFGTNITISRCSNNFGAWQAPEKLLPTIIRKALANEKIPIYGDGLQCRHWIHVDEHNKQIMKILEQEDAKPGAIYNIAPPPDNYMSNMQIAGIILNMLNKPMNLLEHVTDRLAHDTSYYLYSTKCNTERRFIDDIQSVVKWYVENIA